MLIDFRGEILDQFLLSRHGLDQPLKLGGRDGGFGGGRDDGSGSGSDRSRSGGDRGVDGGTRRRPRFAEGAGQADACHVSFAAAVMTFDLGMPILAVRVRRRTTTAAPLVHYLSPLVPFLFLSGERSENRVEPVSVDVHGIGVAWVKV